MSVAVTGTQAGHIYQLQKAGAVVIWPLDDPAGANSSFDIVSNRQLVRTNGSFGVDGPFAGTTAFRTSGDAITGLGTPGSDVFNSGSELLPLNRQMRKTTVTWWMRSAVALNLANRFEHYLNAPVEGPPGTWTWWSWLPIWAGNQFGNGQAWNTTSGSNCWYVSANIFATSWSFLAATLDADDTSLSPTNGASRLYRDGLLWGEGPTLPARPIGDEVWRGFNLRGANSDVANVALFDRVLTLDELETLRESELPPPITTLSGHVAALQRTGAVAIWPLDESTISSGQSFHELSGQNWPLYSAGGQTGIPGPFPDATAYQPAPNANDLYNTDPSGTWPPSIGQPAMTYSCWLFVTNQVHVYVGVMIRWATGSPTFWYIEIVSTTGVSDVSFLWHWPTQVGFATIPQTADRWFHLVSVLDNDTGRFYLDGELIFTGSLSPAGGTSRVSEFYHYSEGSPAYQALALFDRALTGYEVTDLLYAVPPTGAAKVWDGSAWQPASIKGWTGSQWARAKVWTGTDWQEV